MSDIMASKAGIYQLTAVLKFYMNQNMVAYKKKFGNLRVYISLNFKRLKTLKSDSVCSNGLL